MLYLGNTIPTPYGEMLQSLSSVNGFPAYAKWLRKRINQDKSWKAEIHALFEINKSGHPLQKITSSEENEPEGFFLLRGQEALVEAAFVGYQFDRNQEKQKCENICISLFRKAGAGFAPAVLVVIVHDFLKPPSAEEATAILTRIRDQPLMDRFESVPFGRIGLFHKVPAPCEFQEQYGEAAMYFVFQAGGFSVGGHNADLNKKIAQVLKEKQKQHVNKYGGHMKMYYVFVDSPPTKIMAVDFSSIVARLSENDVLAVSAVGSANGRMFQTTRVFGSLSSDIDLSNIHYLQDG
ncbi:MAG: hypothetical protein AABZ06_14595 [Bdellovibrionota bacterium]